MRGSYFLMTLCLFFALPASSQGNDHLFKHIDSLLRQKQYFEASSVFRTKRD